MRTKGLLHDVLLVCLGLLSGIPAASAEPLRVVSYNVENLFYPKHDTVAGIEKEDYEWTPTGERRWSFTRYLNRTD